MPRPILLTLMVLIVSISGVYFFSQRSLSDHDHDSHDHAVLSEPLTPAHECPGNSQQESVWLVTDDGFSPKEMTVELCRRLIFLNTGHQLHQPGAGPHPIHGTYPEIEPDQPIKPQGEFRVLLVRPGDYSIHDHLHPNLTGLLHVTGETPTSVSPIDQSESDPPHEPHQH